MNERIQQLAEQACAFADIQYNKQTRATFYTNKSVEEFFREKFAELIVQECLTLTLGKDRRQLLDKGDLNSANLVQKDIIRVIKHFGVEE